MSDIKISQMEPWVGAVTGNVEFPAVFANENYRIALSQLTPSTFGFGNMALQNSNAVNITGGNVASRLFPAQSRLQMVVQVWERRRPTDSCSSALALAMRLQG